MKKNYMLLAFPGIVVISLAGCALNQTEAMITFSQEKFKVDREGDLTVSGKINGLSKGYYEANVDRENTQLYVDKNGKFSIDTYIVSGNQESFPIGIATPAGEIIVNSAGLDTTDFVKAMEEQAYISPEKIIGLFKKATLPIVDERIIPKEAFPFKFKEGISFVDGSDRQNGIVRVFSYDEDSEFNIAKNYFLNLSSSVVEKKAPDSIEERARDLNSMNDFPKKNIVFEDPAERLQRHIKLFKLYPLYGSRIASDRTRKVIVVAENGIQDPQFEMYRRIIETLGDYYD